MLGDFIKHFLAVVCRDDVLVPGGSELYAQEAQIGFGVICNHNSRKGIADGDIGHCCEALELKFQHNGR
jgi:hypothetical protein